MKQNEVLKHYEFQANIGLEPNILQRVAAQVIDMTDRAILQECIKTASAAGITDLYLLDKQFVSEALAEKLERMKNEPLTIEELRRMGGEPVWVQSPGVPEYGRWAIVEEAVDTIGGPTLYLKNDFTCRNYGKTWLAYRHKPKEEV